MSMFRRRHNPLSRADRMNMAWNKLYDFWGTGQIRYGDPRWFKIEEKLKWLVRSGAMRYS